MKILITHVYSQDNKGDAAILSVMIQQLNKNFKGCKIYASVFDDLKKDNWKEKAQRVESFLNIISQHKNIAVQSIFALYVIISTLLWSLIYRATKKKADVLLIKSLRSVLKHYISSDLILPIGGGYLNRKNSIKETFLLILSLHPIAISKIIGKPTVLYSQSIGLYENPVQSFLAKSVLNHTDLIIVRENISLRVLNSIGIDNKIIKKSVDAGFLFKSNLNFNIEKELLMNNKDRKKPIVGITVRNWLDKNKQKNYENEIAKFCDHIISNYFMNIVFIPQVTSEYHNDDDRKVGQRIIEKMQSKQNVWNLSKNYNHYEIKALYSKLDYLIGTRFHSVIFSLTSHVPAIGIEYEHKTKGIMQDLNLQEWVIKIEDVDSKKLIKIFKKLISKKTDYLKTLTSSLVEYLTLAENTMLHVKEAYNNLNSIRK